MPGCSMSAAGCRVHLHCVLVMQGGTEKELHPHIPRVPPGGQEPVYQAADQEQDCR